MATDAAVLQLGLEYIYPIHPLQPQKPNNPAITQLANRHHKVTHI